MSDRSDELTESRDSRSTDDLLEETEQLLSGSSGGSGLGTESPPADGTDPGTETRSGTATRATDSSGSSRLDALKPSRSAGEYFSPKAFFALFLVLGATVFAGGTVLPFAGGAIGLLVVAFLVGLVTSRRRYLEMIVAGTTAGGVVTVLTEPMLAVAGSMRTVLLVGAAVGLLATVLGYYFGRDLRDGLFRDIE
ncbi:DUF456 domain-containing protein [Salinadaptatus halalkaliphilus]|nr:DUF456 domain-containing protein [Salinadaptatus halalkaliphilus]